MRLHRLTVTAFGPFGATQHVDFDELSAAGLFLLHGPTGAGKTSVLDAVCYGLYGQVPGARQGSGLSLRSDHADPLTPTEVVLELTVGERRLEITRRPEQPRPKKRGTGVTREKAQSLLRAYDADSRTWKALSRSHQEIGAEIEQLLGMSRDQFCQVVLLPQGDFARFLRADEPARAKLLGRLFDTSRFAAVEERLAEQRRAAEKRVIGGDERLLALAHRMAQAAGRSAELDAHPLPEAAAGEPGLADAVLEWAALARAGARERRDIAASALRGAEAVHEAARRAADAESERAALQRRHAEARRRADDLELRRAERDRLHALLDRARAADAVAPALDLRTTAAHAHRRAAAAERTARTHLATDPALEALAHVPAQRPSAEPDAREDARTTGPEPAATVPPARGTSPSGEPDAPMPGRDGNGDPRGSSEAAEPGDTAGAGGVPPARGAVAPGETAPDDRAAVRGGRGAASPRMSGDGPSAGPAGRGTVVGQAGPEAADAGGAVPGAGDGLAVGEEGAAGPRERSGGSLAEAGAEWLGLVERRVRGELGALAAARRGEERARAVVTEIAELDREARADDEAIEEAAQWLAGWESVRLAHQARIEAAQEAATRAEQLGARIEPAERRLDAARERDRLAALVERAREELLRCRERAGAAREGWLDLKDRRLRGIAAELAAGLRPGEPCAVCGGCEHPSPARPGAGHVDRTAEEAAEEEYQRAEAGREEAERRSQRLKEALAGAEAGADGGTVEALDRALAEVRTAYAEARDAAADGHDARAALDRAEGEHARRLAQRQEAERRSAGRTSHREALVRERAALLAELDQARGGDATVAERAARLERQAELLARTAEAVREAEAAARRLKEADAHLADAAYRAGFDTPEAAADAVLSADRRREAQRRLDEWQTEAAAVAAELSDPRLAAAARERPADLAAARAAADAATRTLRDASAADAAARTRCQELDGLSAQAVEDARRLAPLREEYDRVARLATLAAGTSADNERRMRLEAYVLAARLEQVAAAASARLRHMSSGRYTLVHSDARTGGRGRSGLGLHVIDAWTGRERDTATLSGGETFFASLALALGLADVVTDEAGGVRLDTLFIDEGFGSLDEQTLDEVLDVLDSLRERDRTVGIVSHVADLRQRIPARLEVVKGREGSAVRHRTATAALG
ncbi:AAA family ATPase [Streptomyces sp. Rer75]|uniref:AAA family ATPase n=3 Tax=unclassified Streptomyces TaxID=2593676 RepID=UPI0015D090CD|nr:AAA family ATPase [Streptomyces sp. Rer75]QLH20048.1 AAA family ATPase [Streptomyces sp. Rer75]